MPLCPRWISLWGGIMTTEYVQLGKVSQYVSSKVTHANWGEARQSDYKAAASYATCVSLKVANLSLGHRKWISQKIVSPRIYKLAAKWSSHIERYRPTKRGSSWLLPPSELFFHCRFSLSHQTSSNRHHYHWNHRATDQRSTKVLSTKWRVPSAPFLSLPQATTVWGRTECHCAASQWRTCPECASEC